MNLQDAEKVINEYGDILANTPGTAYPISTLPYPKDKIKEAIKSYYTGCTVMGIIDSDMKNQLEVAYIALASFIEDDKAKICLDFDTWVLNNPIARNSIKPDVVCSPNMDEIIKIREAVNKESELLINEVQDIRKYAESVQEKNK